MVLFILGKNIRGKITLENIINENFIIKELVEPVPDEDAIKKRPDFIDEFHRTTCLIIKAQISK
jgi:hypothetical protein